MGILTSSCPPLTALNRARQLDKSGIIQTVKKAGIKEYGGIDRQDAAEKWELASINQLKPEQIIGALSNNDTEHMLLAIVRENTPAVLEGLAIAAYVTGADAIEIAMPKEDAALREKILATAEECRIALKVTVGIVDVLAAKNSIIHHFETAAAIAALFQDKAAYTKTTVVAVKKAGHAAGKAFEIPYGKTIFEVVGAENNEGIKAIGIGTKVYQPSAFDLVIDESFPLENGVITLFDTKCCMVDQAKQAVLAVREQSCGKCTFCREGAVQIHTILEEITEGKGKTTDKELLEEIAEAMPYSCLCSLGQTGAVFPLGVLRHFAAEVEAHYRRKTCPAEVCQAFVAIYINPLTCAGCGQCLAGCPEECIEGRPGFIHMIDEFDCTKCGKCISACPNGSVLKTTGRLPKLPERLTRVGRFK